MPTATRMAPNPALIARLQSEAARHPTIYRWRLVALAIAGDVALTTVQVIFIALPILVGMVFVNNRYIYWLGASAIVLLIWLVRPTYRLQGRELKRDEAPKLFSEIDALRKKLRVSGRMQVLIDDSFNASAAETRGLLGLVGTRRVLTLGIPLLAALSRSQLLGVIGHEFGHFSRRHGRFGHWLYRARVGWLEYANYVSASDSAFDRAAAWYAERFVPYFSTRSFVHSRQCEYEADADGAEAVGAKLFAEALSRVAVLARLWFEGFPRQLMRWQREMLNAPEDLYERFSATAKDWPAKELRAWLDEAMRMPSSWLDTHPSLSERLASVRQGPRLGEAVRSAGEELFGDTWPALLADFNAQWYKKSRSDWTIDHLRYRHVLKPLLDADRTAATLLQVDKQLLRAKALRGLDPPEGLAELRSLYTEFPRNAGIAFAFGAALLSENDHAGVEILERVAKDNVAYRAPAYSRLLAYQERKGDIEQIEKCSFRLNRAEQRRAEAVAAFMPKAELGEFRESSFSQEAQATLSEALRLDRGVAEWLLVQGEEPLATNESANAGLLKVHLLVLAIDTEELKASGVGEAEMKERYEAAVALLVGPDERVVVRTYFTTETLPETFRSRAKLIASRGVQP